ncbi:MAG: hypothetical protein LBT02_04395 [Rickettsiales bacterium]|jgi:hypothetical protein|nr:hypothetical protein [Rickettsiales bacterium]
MCISQNKNRLLLVLLLLLTSCEALLSYEPTKRSNDDFLDTYGTKIERAKEKHYQSIKEQNYQGATFENTAMGREKAREMEFLVSNEENKPYKELENAGGIGIKYLSDNVDRYKEDEIDIFSTIQPEDDDFVRFNKGTKDYTEIDNRELQEDYDKIMEDGSVERYEARLKKLKEDEQKQNDTGTLNKMTKGLKKFGATVKGLLK